MRLSRKGFRLAGSFLLGLLSITAFSGLLDAQPAAADRQAHREPPPGEGVLCAWVFVNAAAEVGRHCRPGQNPALQAELDREVARFDAYALRNGLTPDQVAGFKREQGLSGTSETELCSSDGLGLYDHFVAQGPAVLRAGVDRLLARDGRPSWGDCA